MAKQLFSKTAILVLAAGASERMGQPKQLLQIGGETLLERIVRCALATEANPVAVVLGAHFEKISAAISSLPCKVIRNEDWASGMGSSVACGIRWLEKNHPAADAVILLLCDQPFVSVDLLEKLMQEASTGEPIVACEYGGTLGVPAIFGKALFPELAQLQGKQGAKKVIKKHSGEAVSIPFPEGLFDLDTPADLENLLEKLAKS